MIRHMTIEQLPYGEPIKSWLKDCYGETEANQIWEQTQENYRNYLRDLPDQPPVSELQDFVQNLFMGPFTKLGRVFNLNRPSHMWLIDKIFRKSGNKDRRDILRYSEGFVNIDAPYDKEHHAASYSFTQCPNAEFAKKHGLLHVLPLLCNSDFFGISELHGTLIRCGTCGNSDVCDYLIVGSDNPIAKEYETSTDEQGFLVSRKRQPENARVES